MIKRILQNNVRAGCLPKTANERKGREKWVGSKVSQSVGCIVSFPGVTLVNHLRKVRYLVPASAGGVCFRSVPSHQTITKIQVSLF